MKKGLVMLVLAVASLALVVAFADSDCDYDPSFDVDGDYIMNDGADCGGDYVYDCDDGDKDVFRDCRRSLWQRLVDWLEGAGDARPSNIISGSSVKRMIPGSEEMKSHIRRVSGNYGEEDRSRDDCAVTICFDDDFREIYCPLEHEECCARYSDCRVVECDSEDSCEDEDAYGSYEGSGEEYDGEEYDSDGYVYDYGNGDGSCTEEYHDCFDDGEAVICKGPFDACDETFDGCTCGTSDSMDSGIEESAPDFDASEPVDCPTGVFVCKRQVITMSGDVADSTVTCKESFQRCSMTYGNCRCGNATLTDFPMQHIGGTDVDSGSGNADAYWCDHDGREVPCYMLPGNCTKKKNTCLNEKGQWITCDGSFDYCAGRYEECLCGIEATTSGFMVTE